MKGPGAPPYKLGFHRAGGAGLWCEHPCPCSPAWKTHFPSEVAWTCTSGLQHSPLPHFQAELAPPWPKMCSHPTPRFSEPCGPVQPLCPLMLQDRVAPHPDEPSKGSGGEDSLDHLLIPSLFLSWATLEGRGHLGILHGTHILTLKINVQKHIVTQPGFVRLPCSQSKQRKTDLGMSWTIKI